MALETSAFIGLLDGLYNMGFFVFFLIFTVVFAVLQKTNILGHHTKNFNVAFSLAVSLIVVVPHMTGRYPPQYDVVNIINAALPDVAILAIAGIMLLMLIGLFGGESQWMGTSISGWMAIIAFISIVCIFSSAAGWIPGFYIDDYLSDENLSLVIIILVFAIIVRYITADDHGHGPSVGGVFKGIGDYFGGSGGGGHGGGHGHGDHGHGGHH